MDTEKIRAILDAVAQGKLSSAEALSTLRNLPFEDVGFAKIDLHRSLRQGMAEVIFCPGKTAQQIIEIAKRLRDTTTLFLLLAQSRKSHRKCFPGWTVLSTTSLEK
jgi:NCAIR mutase (PurE)-related protein